MTEKTDIRIGPFELIEELGYGGMATVWKARHVAIGETVAVKVMRGLRARDPDFRAEFRREVQAVASLNHPGIVRVFDYGQLGEQAPEGFVPGSPYLVMEVAEHGTVESRRPRSWGSVRRIVMQVLDALAYSHARGVVHRDIKPENILLTHTGSGHLRAKLSDFGIAYAMTPEAAQTDRNQEAAGTFKYMPPEQFQSEWRSFGPWTDLYALGCTVWRLVTGEPPFQAKSPVQMALAHLTHPLPAFESLFDVPEGLHGWLQRLLAKQPQDRYQCAADAALALEHLSGPPTFRAESDDSADMLEWAGPDDATVRDIDFDPSAATMVLTDAFRSAPSTNSASWVASDAFESRAATVLQRTPTVEKVGRSWREVDEYPRLPASWRRPDAGYSDTVMGMGLGLFGLREVPFVDREPDRDAIWAALRETIERPDHRVVVLRGASGAGKSRVAAWMAQRAVEVGAAQLLRASLSPTAGSSGTFADLLDRYFVTYGLDDAAKVYDIVRRRLSSLWGPEADTGFLDQEARALTAMVSSDADQASLSERVTTVARLVERASLRRPVIVWIDDVQWDLDAFELASHLLRDRSRGESAVLLLMTAQEEALRETRGALEALESLAHLDGAEVRTLQPLAPDDQAELVRKLLGLAPRVSRLVTDATAGNPLFAIQLVGDWIDRGALRAGPQGFELVEEASAPDDLHALWERRIVHVTTPFGGVGPQIALELAAVLGDQVVSDEWRGVCMVAGCEPDERLLDTLIDVGMATRTKTGWAFVHSLLVGSLRRRAREHGRWKELNALCGEVLATLYTVDNPQIARRVSQHFVEAEEWSAALLPLSVVVQDRLAAHEMREAAEWLELRGRALAEAGVPVADIAHVDQLLMQALMLRGSTRGDEGIALLEQVVDIASTNGWNLQLARAYRQLGEDAASDARLDEALELYRLAEVALEDVDDRLEAAAVLESRTWILKSIGRAEEARADLERALDLRRDAGDRIGELNVINRLAFTLLAENDFAGSREVAEVGIEVGREIGQRAAEAGCWTTLGEIERFEGDYDRARECYARAEELDALCGNKHVHLVRSNAALVEVGAGDWPRAVQMLDDIEPVMISIGYGWMTPFLTLARACCAAGLADWSAFDDHWASSLAAIQSNGIVEIDVAWLAEIAAAAAAKNGDLERAIACQRYAAQTWDDLNDSWKLREARITLRTYERAANAD